MSKYDEITNGEDVIDSRDIIERIAYLEDEMEDFKTTKKLPSFDWEDKWEGSEYDTWDKRHKKHDMEWAISQWETWEHVEEYRALKAIEQECEGYGDWQYGETLIRDSYWQSYIEELIKDCYEMPKEMNNGAWPWRHFTMDYEAAAEEAKEDYMSVDFDGVDYWMRSC